MDWNIVIASVNGTGSLSANQLLAQGFFNQGYWVGTKNIFPSNISGLPTWFAIRVNPEPYVGLRAKADVLVCLNATTFEEDLRRWSNPNTIILTTPEVGQVAGSYRWVGVMPIKATLDEFQVPVRLKKLVGNLFYVGVIWAIFGLSWDRLRELIEKTFSRKNDVVDWNVRVARAGFEWFSNQGLEPFWRLDFLKVDGNRVFMDGNTAAALGLLWAGATFAAWYPITPATSLMETFERLAKTLRPEGSYVVVQAEDELAAICMVSGAGWQGARAFTATSGPGFSLMQEALGYAYFAEIPFVVWHVQRVGPSTGLPTRTQQADLLQAFWASHGDTWHPLLFPSNLKECFELGQWALDVAHQLQTPVIVMSDLDLGMNLRTESRWILEQKPFNKGQIVVSAPVDYARYRDDDGDGVAARTLPGDDSFFAAYTMRGSGHNSKAQYSEKPEDYEELMNRLKKKWSTALQLLPKGLFDKQCDGADWIVHYGSSQEPVRELVFKWRQQGFKVNSWRIRSLPIPDPWWEWISPSDRLWVVDLNRDGQMATWLKAHHPQMAHQIRVINHFNGYPLSVDELEERLKQAGFGENYASIG